MFFRGFFYLALIILATGCGGGASSGTTYTSSESASSSSQSSSAASPSPSAEPKKIVLQWQRPDQRENGEYLEADEIGGYELRYKKLDSNEYKYVVMEDGWSESYEFQQKLVGAYEFQLAAFDTNGLYSEFVDLQVYN